MSQTHFVPKTTEPVPATPVPTTADVDTATAPSAPARHMADPATLHRATDGRLARAGHALRQLQRRHGNAYVQRVIAATPPAPKGGCLLGASPAWGGSRDLADEASVPPPNWGRLGGGEKSLPANGGETPNRTGLPDTLKAGVEALSGLNLDAVRVHYNSPQPARLNALAYTQGTEIHVAPGQERHLAHEAWHVVQQMEGRVKPTTKIDGVAINNDVTLEQEADLEAERIFQPKLNLQQPLYEEKSAMASLTQSVTQFIRPSKGKWSDETEKIYNAQKSNETNKSKYEGGRPCTFSPTVKEKILERWRNNGIAFTENSKWMVRTASDYILPAEAIQIDHITPWLVYENELEQEVDKDVINSLPPEAIIVENSKNSFTVYAAKMYYHDFINLQPEVPGLNAAKGAKQMGEGIILGSISEKAHKESGLIAIAATKRLPEWINTWKTAELQKIIAIKEIGEIDSKLGKIWEAFGELEDYTLKLEDKIPSERKSQRPQMNSEQPKKRKIEKIIPDS